VLVASLLASIAIMGIVQLWTFSYNMTASTDSEGVAYNLARQALEAARQEGHTYLSEGSTIDYYDMDGNLLNSSTGAKYKVTTTVASDVFVTDSGGTPILDDYGHKLAAGNSLRTVTASVVDLTTGQVVQSSGCELARRGI
jgi:type II secretory pathway pseudopilin PulG